MKNSPGGKGGRRGEKGVGGYEGRRREERKRQRKAPIRTVVVTRCGIRAAGPSSPWPSSPSLPPFRREKRERFVGESFRSF
jgi:hypothetical protein